MALFELETSFATSFGDEYGVNMSQQIWNFPTIDTPNANKRRNDSELPTTTHVFSPLVAAPQSSPKGRRIPFSDARNRQQQQRQQQRPLAIAAVNAFANRNHPGRTSNAANREFLDANSTGKENMAPAFAPKSNESFYNATEHDFDADMSTGSSLPNFSILKSPNQSLDKSAARFHNPATGDATVRQNAPEAGFLTAAQLGATDADLGFGTQGDIRDVLARDEALFDADVSRIDEQPSSPFGGGHHTTSKGRSRHVSDSRSSERSNPPTAASHSLHLAAQPANRSQVESSAAQHEAQSSSSSRGQNFAGGSLENRSGGTSENPSADSKPHLNRPTLARPPPSPEKSHGANSSKDLHHPTLDRPLGPGSRRRSARTGTLTEKRSLANTHDHGVMSGSEWEPESTTRRSHGSGGSAQTAATEQPVKKPIAGFSYGDPAALQEAHGRMHGAQGAHGSPSNHSTSPPESPSPTNSQSGFPAHHARMTDSIASSLSSSSNTSHASYASSHASYQAHSVVGMYSHTEQRPSSQYTTANAFGQSHSGGDASTLTASDTSSVASSSTRKASSAGGMNPLNYSHHSDMSQASTASSHASYKPLPEDRQESPKRTSSHYGVSAENVAHRPLSPTSHMPADNRVQTAPDFLAAANRDSKQHGGTHHGDGENNANAVVAQAQNVGEDDTRRELDFSSENIIENDRQNIDHSQGGGSIEQRPNAWKNDAARSSDKRSEAMLDRVAVGPLSVSQIDNTLDFAGGHAQPSNTISMSPLVKVSSSPSHTHTKERSPKASHSPSPPSLARVDTYRRFTTHQRSAATHESENVATGLHMEEKSSETPLVDPSLERKEEVPPKTPGRSVSFMMDQTRQSIATPRPMDSQQAVQRPTYRSAQINSRSIAAGFQPTRTPTREEGRSGKAIRTPVSMLKKRGGGGGGSSSTTTTPSRPLHRARSPPPGTPLTPVHHTVNSSIARFEPQNYLSTPGNQSSSTSSSALASMSPWAAPGGFGGAVGDKFQNFGSPDSRMSEFRPSDSFASSVSSLSLDKEIGIVMRDGVAVTNSPQVAMVHRFAHFEVDTRQCPIHDTTREHFTRLSHKLGEKAFRVPHRPKLVHVSQQANRTNWFSILWVVPREVLDIEARVEQQTAKQSGGESSGVGNAAGDGGVTSGHEKVPLVAEWVAAFFEIFSFAKVDGVHFTSLEPLLKANQQRPQRNHVSFHIPLTAAQRQPTALSRVI